MKNPLLKRILIFFIAINGVFLKFAYAESIGGGSSGSEKIIKHQRCYLISYYTQQAIVMRYSGFSRFEMMSFFKNITSADVPDELAHVNNEALLGVDKYIDEAFEVDFLSDESEAEKLINRKKDLAYSQCMSIK